MGEQQENTATVIRALADRHGVNYAPTSTDEWARHITRLAGDDVKLDTIELLLIELQRAGYLGRPAALQLQVTYLREVR